MAENTEITSVEQGERTGAQNVGSVISMSTSTLSKTLPRSYRTYRQMRTDPTIALARALSVAPIVAGSWVVEADEDAPPDAKKLIEDVFLPQRRHIMETALFGGIDFGWQGFEQVYAMDGKRIIIDKFKPLLQDTTNIRVVGATGAYSGLVNTSNNDIATLDPEYTLTVSFRVEGTDWYGQSLMENARASYNQWNEANAGAERYDQKIAGSHIVLWYPVGETSYDGVMTSNQEIAQELLTGFLSSGATAMPQSILPHAVEKSNENKAWHIQLVEDKGGRQPTFVARLKYLDALKVRALLVPERAIIEGEFGTKAEAGEHGDWAITHLELQDQLVTDKVNRYSVSRVMGLNFGPESVKTVRLKASPLADASLGFLMELYKGLATGQLTAQDEFYTIDMDALKDKLGVPKSGEMAPAGEMPAEGDDQDELRRLLGDKIPVLPRGEE